MSLVQVDDHGAIRRLTLRDPRRRNALTGEVLTQFVAQLEESAGAGIRALVLSAEPEQGVWSAGHDIGELPSGDRDPLTWDNPLEAALRAVRDAPFPIIAEVDGSVWGGACDLVATADLVVATRASQFAITPARLGIPYNTAGVAHFLGALPVHVVKEMFFTADPMPADRAFDLGFVNRLVADRAEATATANSLAERIADLAPLAIAAIKAEISTLSDARHLTSDEFEKLNNLRTRAWMSRDYREGLAAFHERRSPRFTGE